VPAGAEGTEDEVMLAVVPVSGARLEPADVAAHADRVLPRFARPRYVEVVDALPKTPTQKVRKQELRTRAVTASTWDREAHRG
jgi:crotonobetaine/carnitine-CoA ligase